MVCRWLERMGGEVDAANGEIHDRRHLRELHREDDPHDGVLAGLVQLLTVSARTAERLDTDGDGDASGPLHDAAALLTDQVPVRLYWATRVLDPEGEPA
ncbi:hypothetical protein QFZ76_010254 [Streptomyces sp. V4I2]|nr:hypothetical protein [Streptomyces sp. V4I2]